eukprot:GEMP01031397.1.p1 GENE.GEMP01031397.1~~GEMP01031397.1.p1  ORF type:complete len:389 (+),score=52.12 GEMP01031397.1:116-1282(+)
MGVDTEPSPNVGVEYDRKAVVDYDVILNELHRLRDCPPGTPMNTALISEDIVAAVAYFAKCKFLEQPMLLDLEGPIKICGDVHGQYYDLMRLFELGISPPESNYLFLGDYVDRGKQSLECLMLLYSYRMKYPENFFLLRGNHECENINRQYGFLDECKRRYSLKLWKMFCHTFNAMPVAARISNRIFCMHGGLSPHLNTIDEVAEIERPCECPDSGLLCDLLWSDPGQDPGWVPNARGVSYAFGPDVIHEFCDRHGIDLICRAHQVVQEGYEFFADRRLVTVFGAPNYCGEFNNAAAICVVKEDLVCSFQILGPAAVLQYQTQASTGGMTACGATLFPRSEPDSAWNTTTSTDEQEECDLPAHTDEPVKWNARKSGNAISPKKKRNKK